MVSVLVDAAVQGRKGENALARAEEVVSFAEAAAPDAGAGAVAVLGGVLGVSEQKQARIQQKIASEAAMKMMGGWKGMMKMAKALRKLDPKVLEQVMKDPSALQDNPEAAKAIESLFMEDPEMQKMMMSQMQDLMKDPSVQSQMEEAMKDPAVQQQMQEAMKDPEVQKKMQEAMNDPQVQKEMQEAMNDPQVQKQMAEAMKDPEVQKKMQEAMEDPEVKAEVLKAMQDPEVQKKMQ